MRGKRMRRRVSLRLNQFGMTIHKLTRKGAYGVYGVAAILNLHALRAASDHALKAIRRRLARV